MTGQKAVNPGNGYKEIFSEISEDTLKDNTDKVTQSNTATPMNVRIGISSDSIKAV